MKKHKKIMMKLMTILAMQTPLDGSAQKSGDFQKHTAKTEEMRKKDSTQHKNKQKPCIYSLPYSMKTSVPDYKRMWINTGVLFGGGLAALGVLEILPENATAWNKEELRKTPFLKRWSKHVRQGPVWDKDDHFINYVLHPYAGAAYYMGARSLGFNAWGSLLYCTAISTLFWEYGIEAFMEIPSIQDLIVTPVAGLLLGESFYILKRHIVNNGYELFGSKLLGNVAAFIIDPVNEVVGLFTGNPARDISKGRTQISCTPWMCPYDGGSIGFTLKITQD